MVTFRLADSLPAEVVEQLRNTRFPRGDVDRRMRAEAYLDAGHGACYLRDPSIAKLVEGALLRFDGERYRLLAWSVMPNHVHALVEILPGYTLTQMLHTWKSYTAHAANRALGRSGAFWQVEYWDRYIRDEEHLRNTAQYIHGNRSRFSSAARARSKSVSKSSEMPALLTEKGRRDACAPRQ
ncbi:MAG: transposase, partial [Armatimonadetes bacterium]|nr:transposase [Armatimonadota bacterium]